MLLASGAESASKFVTLDVPTWAWIAFLGVFAALLLFDVLVLHREAHIPTFRRALIETCCWLSVGVVFGVIVLAGFGKSAAGEYFAGFLLELSLSVDNVFVWALILGFFAVPRAYQHRVLFWGIFGAIVLRAVFIFGGVALVNRFEWILVGFGLLLLYSAFQLLRHDDDDDVDYETNRVLKVVRRVVPSTNELDGQKLFTQVDGKRLATPLFAVLVLVETTDVLFAVDSVPAVLGVAREQFIVLTSNAFAILGLRALYFLFAGLKDKFAYLQQGLALILAFVGVKMILEVVADVHAPTWLSLLVIVVVLVGAVLLSALADRRNT